MEGFAVLIGLGTFVIVFVLPIVAMVRTGSGGGLWTRIRALESELAEARRELREMARALRERPATASVPVPTAKVLTAEVPTAEVPTASPLVETAPTAEAAKTAAADEAPPALPPPVAETAPPPAAPFEWERWLGVRGAALLGAVVLGLAGILFVRYSIERGLIPPAVRVGMLVLAGLGCLIFSERALTRYPASANPIAGAGVVLLYAAFYSLYGVYHLAPMEVAFALMALSTAVCCLLALRRSSLLVALLGLVGGFVTPLLLSTGVDRPIGLFGYILVLDTGFLLVAVRRRWATLALVSLLFSVLFEAAWMLKFGAHHSVFLSIGIFGVFGLLFALVGARVPAEVDPAARGMWRIGLAAGIFIPQAFAIYLAANAEFGRHFYVGLLLFMLNLAGGIIARRQKAYWLLSGGATATLVVFGAWLLANGDAVRSLAWEASLSAFVLAALFHLFVELDADNAELTGPALGAQIFAGGAFVGLCVAALQPHAGELWPWLAGFLGLGALAYRHAQLAQREWMAIVVAAGLGLALFSFLGAHHDEPHFLSLSLFVVVEALLAAVFSALAMTRSRPTARTAADHAAATVALLFLGATLLLDKEPPLLALGAAALFAALIGLAAARLGRGQWLCVAVAALSLSDFAYVTDHASSSGRTALPILFATALLFTVWPFVFGAAFRRGRSAWYAAALISPLLFEPMRQLYVERFGAGTIGALPVVLGAVSILAAVRTLRHWPAGDPIRRSALVWLAAVGLCFVSVAIPLQLDKQWITVGWALEGLAVMALWQRLDHAGLKWFSLALLGATTVRLVANPSVLEYYDRSGMRIFNWILYAYFIPIGCLLGAARILGSDERKRIRAWEQSLYSKYDVGRVGTIFAAIVVGFVWLNLAIADWFSTGAALTISFERQPARDLTTSIGWALYAIMLLALGMARASSALRWTSLTVLIITIGKVFLYDLGQLHDLYRVMSLVGLAFSLILVSLAYQQFVFRKPPTEKS